MMDLRGIANSAITRVNPNLLGTVFRSAGYTIDPATRRQVPAYDTPISGPVQMQALDGNTLAQIDNINQMGAVRAVYLKGNLAGVIRAEDKGGDKILIGGQTWLVFRVLESWATWTKVAVSLQTEP